MKILLILMTAFLMQVSASTFAQKITLNEKEVSLVSIFEKINKQSGVDFLVNIELLSKAKPVSINVNNEELAVVLDKIFKGQPLEYSIKDKAVVVTKKSPTFLERLADRWASIDVHGRVVDQNGRPLSGATVKVKVSGKSVSTSAKGEFYLEKVDEDAVLVISFIGYMSKEVNVRKEIGDVALEQSDSKLDEVQVIAYGETTRRLSTGNIGGIKAKDIEKQPVINPLLALQGRTPGIFISQNTGYAGGGVTVRIQGQNSIGFGNDPFYVIDGVPYISQLLPNRSAILVGSGAGLGQPEAGNGNPLNFLNPANIESIEVLKDADATAIYGSRAANGAILITTKKGKVGQTKMDFTLQNGLGKVARKMKMLNTEQYLAMRREAYTNDGLVIPTPMSAKNNSNYDLTVFDQDRYTDWQKKLFGGTANYTDAQLSISGGTGLTIFRINGGYHRQTTVLPADFADKKASLGVNIDHSSTNNKFKLAFSGNLQNDDNRLLASDITRQVLTLPPNAPALRNADGTLNWNRIETNPLTRDSISTWTNPLGAFEQAYQIKTSNLVSNLNLSYLLAKGLMLKTSLGYTDLVTSDIARFPLSRLAPEFRLSNPRVGLYSDSRAKSWIFEPQLNYNVNIGDGQATFLLGSTFQENTSNLKAIRGQGYNSDEVIGNFQAASTITSMASIQSMYKYNAVFGRINYNWQEKYIVNLTARRDGSSRFGKENRFENFGAVGAAWLFSNEDFLKNNFAILSFGKLRGSYGTTGSDQIGNYRYLNLYNNITPVVPYQGFTGLTPTGLPNPYLQWELTKKLQGGIDLGFIKDRILLTFGYFNNRSSNQLLDYSLPMQTGFSSLLQNLPAKIENKGWEFTINTVNFEKRNFTWSTNINLTINKNKLLEFPGLETSTYATSLIIGKPIGTLMRFDFVGVDPETGFYQYRTVDGKITRNPDFQKDMYIPINYSPRFYGGIQNSLTYKDFNLDFLFQFVRQNGQGFETGYGNIIGTKLNQPNKVLDRWRKKGDQTTIGKFSTTMFDDYIEASTINSGDASYIRVKNLSFSYNLPVKWSRAIYLERCRVFTQGQNLFTISNYIGLDPETPGNGTMPPLRVITFGLQISM